MISDSLVLVSSCLTGLCTRYDGQCKPSPACMQHLSGRVWIPVCPEQLGGLATPRAPAEIIGGDGGDVLAGSARVVDEEGNDVTTAFIEGAGWCLHIARQQNIGLALLKAGSPSCGLSPVPGVTAALLQQNGIKVREV